MSDVPQGECTVRLLFVFSHNEAKIFLDHLQANAKLIVKLLCGFCFQSSNVLHLRLTGHAEGF
jgi:hypothetical protein